MATWARLDSAPESVVLYSEKITRDAERKLVFGSVMEAANVKAEKAFKHADFNKTEGIITVHTDFVAESGYELKIHNTPAIFSPGVKGDSNAIDQSVELDLFTQSLNYDYVRLPFQSSGRKNDEKTLISFMETAEKSGARWGARQMEGALVAMLWGLATPNNPAKLRYLNQLGVGDTTLATVMGNTLSSYVYDSSHIIYGGPGTYTTDAEVAADSGAGMSAALLDTIITSIEEDADIPIEYMTIDGQDTAFMFVPGRVVEQLRADPDYQRIVQQTSGSENKLVKRAIGRYGSLVIIEYSNCLNPAANVARCVIAGRNALQFCKKSGLEPWTGTKDTHDWIKLYALAMGYGVAPTYFDGTRRNSWAVDVYVRS